MANRQGHVDLRFAQVSAPVRTLAWFGCCMSRVEVRCPYPHPEAAGVRIEVSSPCYVCPLVLYVSSRQIHGDLGVSLFADHNRALTASFDLS